jgi:UDP-N-acetylmuramoyl-tripeptide--D-alanyl-D-alanine ligase
MTSSDLGDNAGNCAAPLMTFAELRAATGASFFGGEGGRGGFTAVCIDSRAAQQGSLFAALAGSSQDGHRFVEAAFASGAVAALVAREGAEAFGLVQVAAKYNAALFMVEDTLRALQDAACAYLDKFPNLLKIGITGSSGKTTTKEIAAAILGCEKRVVMNQGNLNSETGLPLSVFEVRESHEVGIFEMGMNRKGEIAELARVLRPRISLITNIGSAHVGLLGSRDAIAAEKKAVFSTFAGGETALIPGRDDYRDFLAHSVKGKTVFYGEFPELGQITDKGLDGAEIVWDGIPVRFPLPGSHNIKNALAAIAIAKEAGACPASIRAGLAAIKPLFGRGEIIRGDVTIVQDCYNANPESAEAAVGFCDGVDWKTGRRIYVLGSMLELGEASQTAHEALGRVLAASKADLVCLFGKETLPAAAVLQKTARPPFFYTENMQELCDFIVHQAQKGDLILLKGSRGCALERVTREVHRE